MSITCYYNCDDLASIEGITVKKRVKEEVWYVTLKMRYSEKVNVLDKSAKTSITLKYIYFVYGC